MNKILITGASGLLGTKLMNTLPAATGWHLSHDSRGSTAVDITNAVEVDRAMDVARPNVCIHCAANVNIAGCENDPAAAALVNVTGTEHIAAACERNQTRMIFVSTDYIFDGSQPSYDESSPSAPLNVYGRTKAEAEAVVLRNPYSLVLRLPLLFGYNGPHDKITWPREVCQKLRSDEPFDADHREVRQPTLIDDVAGVVDRLTNLTVSGILHVAAGQALTKFDWAVMIAQQLGANQELIKPSDGTPPGAKRPQRSWLDTGKLTNMSVLVPRPANVTTSMVLSHYAG